MLDHLLEAQKEGKTAEEVFGKSPRDLADEIILTLPKEPMKKIVEFFFEVGMQFLGVYLVVIGIGPLISGEEKVIRIGSMMTGLILLLAGFALIVFFLLKFLQAEAFKPAATRKTFIWKVASISTGTIAVYVSYLLLVEPFGSQLTVSSYTYFGMGCFLLLVSFLMKKMREAN